jgi:ubiquinone/menaquinone biosynthesis C-methylase UbiE
MYGLVMVNTVIKGERYQHPRFAGVYMRLARIAERQGAAAHRDRLLDGLTGRVIEVGAGPGTTFRHYPHTVGEVIAVEPEDRLRAHAERTASEVPVAITVVAGHAEELPAADGSMDAAVTSLVLCSVPAPATALAQIARVLKPGGEFRFYEHVRSPQRVVGLAQDLIAPLWSLAAGGCHPNRDTAAAIRSAGFCIEELDRIPFGLTHILGRARRPGAR